MEQSTDQKIAQRGRLLALVIAGTMRSGLLLNGLGQGSVWRGSMPF